MENKTELIDILKSVNYTEDEINDVIGIETGKITDIETIDKTSTRLINTIKSYVKHEREKTQLGFVPGLPVTKILGGAPSFIPGSSYTSLFDAATKYGAEKGAAMISEATGGVVKVDPSTAVKVANELLGQMGDSFKASGFSGGRGGMSSGGDNNPYATDARPGTGFTYIPKPLEVRFTPNVPNTVYGEVTVRPENPNSITDGSKFRTRYHMNTVRLKLPNFGSASSQTTTDYFNRVFIPNLQIRAQGSVSFNIRAQNTFTAAKLTAYFNKIIEALSIYYFYSHTYAYTAVSANKNTAMFELRELFATSDVQNLRLLEERLNGLPIPSRVNELCYWLFDIYRVSSVAGSDIIRLSPIGFDNADPAKVSANKIKNGASIIGNLLTDLSDIDFSKTADLLARVCPNWVNNKVGSSMGIPLHDPSFATVFFNQQLVQGLVNADDMFTAVPEYLTANTETTYNSYCEEIDGVIQSLFSWHDSNTSTNGTIGWMEGLPCGIGGQYTNRLTYMEGTEGAAFYSYYYFPVQWQQRPDTYRFNGSHTTLSMNDPHSVPVLGVSPASVAEASINAIGYLLDIGTVGTNAANKSEIESSDPITASGRGRRRKRK